MKLTTFEEWLNEAKTSDTHVNATVNASTKSLKKGDSVKVDALQYTKGGNNDKVEVILSNGKSDMVEKKFLDVKF
jgi:archaellum component FlaG (FlaF/FlaG flagellin family)